MSADSKDGSVVYEATLARPIGPANAIGEGIAFFLGSNARKIDLVANLG